MKKLMLMAISFAALVTVASADVVPWNLGGGNFSQDWTNTGLITTANDWSGVGSISGYRGDDAAQGTAVDPQTIVADYSAPLNVQANQTNPSTNTTGGLAEFQLTDPVVALQGSGTADNPNLVIYLNATARQNVTISYDLRDVDGAADNAVTPVALQYRLSNSGNWTNVAAGFVADASSGPSAATMVSPVSASLAAWDNASVLEIRILTTNAAGSDEWIGVDNIRVTSNPVPEPTTMVALGLGAVAAVVRRRKK